MRVAPEIELDEQQRAAFGRWARGRSAPHRLCCARASCSQQRMVARTRTSPGSCGATSRPSGLWRLRFSSPAVMNSRARRATSRSKHPAIGGGVSCLEVDLDSPSPEPLEVQLLVVALSLELQSDGVVGPGALRARLGDGRPGAAALARRSESRRCACRVGSCVGVKRAGSGPAPKTGERSGLALPGPGTGMPGAMIEAQITNSTGGV